MHVLTEQWMDTVTTTLAREADLPQPISDRTTVVDVTVTKDPELPITMRLRITPTEVVLEPDLADGGAAVGLSLSLETMARLCRDDIKPGDAFGAGLIEVAGDIGELVGLAEVFDEVVWVMSRVEGDGWRVGDGHETR